MERKLPNLKLIIVDGVPVPHIEIDAETSEHPNNKGKNITVGWNKLTYSCSPPCPPATVDGYYQCISGQCVYLPY